MSPTHSPKQTRELGLDDLISKQIKEALHDGISVGLEMAAESLRTTKPHIDPANQTWDSAVAFLAIVKAEHAKARPTQEGA